MVTPSFSNEELGLIGKKLRRVVEDQARYYKTRQRSLGKPNWRFSLLHLTLFLILPTGVFNGGLILCVVQQGFNFIKHGDFVFGELAFHLHDFIQFGL